MTEIEKSRASVGARRSADTETAVLDATAKLIAEVGYAAVTMEAVAKQARAGKATLYRWWPSKAHLTLALVSRAKQDVAAPATGSLRGDLTAYLDEVLALWRGDGGSMPIGPLVRALYSESWGDAALAQALNEERQQRWIRLDDIFAVAAAQGELSPRLTPQKAKDLTMALPIYLLMTDNLPRPGETAAMVDDILPGLIAP